MDLKLLHMFTLPGGKQGRRSAGRTHVLTLYTNILFPSPPIPDSYIHCITSLVSQLCCAGLCKKHQYLSPQPTRQEQPCPYWWVQGTRWRHKTCSPAKPKGICDRPVLWALPPQHERHGFQEQQWLCTFCTMLKRENSNGDKKSLVCEGCSSRGD